MKILFELCENELDITPMKVAEALTNVKVEIDTSPFQTAFGIEKSYYSMFDCDDLLEIADYLKVYCKYNMEEGGLND